MTIKKPLSKYIATISVTLACYSCASTLLPGLGNLKQSLEGLAYFGVIVEAGNGNSRHVNMAVWGISRSLKKKY